MAKQKHVNVRGTKNQLHGNVISLLQQGRGSNFPGLIFIEHFLRFHGEKGHIVVNYH